MFHVNAKKERKPVDTGSQVTIGRVSGPTPQKPLDVFGTEGLERSDIPRLMPQPRQRAVQFRQLPFSRIADVGAAGHDAGDVAGDKADGADKADKGDKGGTGGKADGADKSGTAGDKGKDKGGWEHTGSKVSVEVSTSGCGLKYERDYGPTGNSGHEGSGGKVDHDSGGAK